MIYFTDLLGFVCAWALIHWLVWQEPIFFIKPLIGALK